ncbi:MAG: DUF3313 domain-containing protein [Nitrospirales bacterium]|nr:DUF3313 domain-containing protein [Nitrospirales bacterium]
MKNMTLSGLLVIVVFILSGCAETRGTYGMMNPDFPHYGFLGEYYEKLEPAMTKSLEPAMRYQAPESSQSRSYLYQTHAGSRGVFPKAERSTKGLNVKRTLKIFTNYLHNKMYLALKDDIEIVDQPGPNTVRMAIALTDTETRWVGLDIISTFVPQLRAVSELKGFVTGKPSFVGKAIAEAKISDSQTGQMLAAMVDKRVGGKTLGKGFSEWADVTDAMDYWAQMAKYRFCRVQKRTNCVPPEA